MENWAGTMKTCVEFRKMWIQGLQNSSFFVCIFEPCCAGD